MRRRRRCSSKRRAHLLPGLLRSRRGSGGLEKGVAVVHLLGGEGGDLGGREEQDAEPEVGSSRSCSRSSEPRRGGRDNRGGGGGGGRQAATAVRLRAPSCSPVVGRRLRPRDISSSSSSRESSSRGGGSGGALLGPAEELAAQLAPVGVVGDRDQAVRVERLARELVADRRGAAGLLGEAEGELGVAAAGGRDGLEEGGAARVAPEVVGA